MAETSTQHRATYVAPRNLVEEQLSKIWEDVLGRQGIGMEDDFFDLGGESVLAGRILSRLEKEFGSSMTLLDFYKAPTIQATGAALQEQTRAPERFISVAQRPESLPVSYSQEQIWLLTKLGLGEVYHTFQVVKVTGPLEEDMLGRALTSLLHRHESLRTSFREVDQELRQEVSDLCVPPIEKHDLSKQAENHEAVEAILRKWIERKFDLAHPPLWRAILLGLGPEEHILGWCMHHIICDGWSLRILRSELQEAYEAHSEGRGLKWNPLPIQYADFAIWQRATLGSGQLEEGLQYWEKQLAGYQELELRAVARPDAGNGSASCVRVYFNQQETSELRRICQQKRLTLYTLLVASVHAVASRHSRQRDICIAMPVANRKPWETEGLVGCFLNTVVLRLSLESQERGEEWLQRVRAAIAEAHDWQQIPFVKIVDRLKAKRHLGSNPIVQIAVNHVDRGRGTGKLGKAAIKDEQINSVGAKFDLMFDLNEDPGGTLELELAYNIGAFERGWSERMSGQVRRVMMTLASEPNRRIGDIDLLGEQEKLQILQAWNDTKQELPEATLAQLFEAQVEKSPEAIALEFEALSVSYGELDRRANQLASYLRSLGVGPEVRVGLVIERGEHMLVGLLGVVKAGGVYVPIDPGYPAERRAFLTEDADVRVLLTTSSATVDVGGYAGHVHYLDRPPLDIDKLNFKNVPVVSDGNNLAYVLYTSGSTGKPKGVMVRQRAVVNFLHAMHLQGVCSAHDVLLAVTPLSFDIAVLELFLPLVLGARLVLANREITRDGKELTRTLKDRGATVMQATPAIWRLLLQAGWEERDLRRILCGGEAMSSNLKDALLRHCPEVWNLYGPTETTIWSAAAPLDQVQEVSIGSPLANTQLYVLDENFEALPPGVTGELYIGGEGLARGYLHRSDLTAERFLANPYGLAGARMYRTGDLVKQREDGQIQFLGRADNQIKIRGFRIEPGEIEAEILGVEGIEHAAVLALEDECGERRVVAYFACARGSDVDSAAVRHHLSQVLPDYMVPAVLLRLEELPLTTSGKVHRRALPAPPVPLAPVHRRPRSTIEEMLEGIWCQVLRCKHVGVEENFFQVGGHSLVAMQLVSRVQEAFRLDLPVRAVFESPSIAAMARKIEACLRAGAQAVAAPCKRTSWTGRLPLSFGQRGIWFFQQLETENAYNITAIVRLKGRLSASSVGQSLGEITRRHEVLRTTFPIDDGEPRQLVHAYAAKPIPFVDLTSIPEQQKSHVAEGIVQDETRWIFHLETGPLLRPSLLRLREEEHLLLLTMHHAVADGWSGSILLHELSAIYSAFVAGRGSALEDLSCQFAEFALWQQAWVEGEAYKRDLEYWRNHLQGAEPSLRLPSDRPRPRTLSSAGAVEYFELPGELSSAVSQLSRRENVTPYMTLLSAFSVVLQVYTQQSDILVGSLVASRNRTEWEPLVGFFVNTLVMRIDLSGDPIFSEVLKRVRELTLDAYLHQNVPFEKLVEELAPERNPSRRPLFQTMFVFQNMPQESFEAAGLEASLSIFEPRSERFDLRLVMAEARGQLVGKIKYGSALFDRTTIRRLLLHFRRILEAVTASPGCRLRDILLLTDSERHQVLYEWSRESAWIGKHPPTSRAIRTIAPDVSLSAGAADSPLTYILDPERHPTPIGVTGEVHVGGLAVDFQQLGSAHSLRNQLVPDLYAGSQNTWMYKTGLLGRYLANGQIKFLADSCLVEESTHAKTAEEQPAADRPSSEKVLSTRRAELARRRKKLGGLKRDQLSEWLQ
jgi:amino acid adenylation domain-containing protein